MINNIVVAVNFQSPQYTQCYNLKKLGQRIFEQVVEVGRHWHRASQAAFLYFLREDVLATRRRITVLKESPPESLC